MKVAFLNFYSGFTNRGGETYVHELANRLTKTHETFVFQSGSPDTKANYTTVKIGRPPQSGYKTDHLSSKHWLKRLFLDFRKIDELRFTLKSLLPLIKLNPDIIFTLNSGYQSLIIAIYCRLTHKKHIIPGQSGFGWNDRWNLLLHPDLFICLTGKQRAWAKKASIWHSQQLAKIPNGVNMHEFSPYGKKAKIHLHPPILLLVGASIPSKKIIQTITAVSKLKSLSLLVIGSGYLDKPIDDLGNQLLPGRFSHLQVSHHNISNYYRSANLFTLCSDSSEAFGIVYLEAMASDLACVATDDQTRREIVGSAGLFVKNADDSVEYSHALFQALKTNWHNKPINQASKYSWDKIAKQYLSVLSKLSSSSS